MSSPLPLYPVALLLRGRRCLVVGGGPIACRKIDGLLAAQAQVTVVAPSIIDEITSLPIQIERRSYETGDAAGYHLVITATGIPEVDRRVFADGEAAGVLVNAADDVAGCSFILPAVTRRGDVTIAVSTGGRSPALASWVRGTIERGLPNELAALAELVGNARDEIRASGTSTEGLPWMRLLEGPLPELVASGELDEARVLLNQWTAHVLKVVATGGAFAASGDVADQVLPPDE